MAISFEMPQLGQRWQAKQTLEWARAITEAVETMSLEIDKLNRIILGIQDHSLFAFRVQEEKGDYLVCKPDVNGVGKGTVTFNVAKPYLLRQSSYDGKTISYDGTDYTFTKDATDPDKRTSDDGSTTETHLIVPQYVVKSASYEGDVIYAKGVGNTMQVTDEANHPIGFVDANLDGRAWAKE